MAVTSRHFEYKALNMFGAYSLPNDITRPLVDIIGNLLFKYDLLSIAFINNSYEYYPEAITIIRRLQTAIGVSDIKDIVHSEFTYWFGRYWHEQSQEMMQENKFYELLKDIWQAWLDCK